MVLFFLLSLKVLQHSEEDYCHCLQDNETETVQVVTVTRSSEAGVRAGLTAWLSLRPGLWTITHALHAPPWPLRLS